MRARGSARRKRRSRASGGGAVRRERRRTNAPSARADSRTDGGSTPSPQRARASARESSSAARRQLRGGLAAGSRRAPDEREEKVITRPRAEREVGREERKGEQVEAGEDRVGRLVARDQPHVVRVHREERRDEEANLCERRSDGGKARARRVGRRFEPGERPVSKGERGGTDARRGRAARSRRCVRARHAPALWGCRAGAPCASGGRRPT